jgi:uncharacterized integral membrane protein
VTTPEPRPTGIPGTDPVGPSLGGGPSGQPAGSTGPVPTGGPAAPARGSGTARPARSTGRTIGRTLALALLIFVTVVLVLFVMFNTQTVDISLVFTDVEAPLVLALLIAAVLGGLLVALAGAVLRARHRNR